MKLKGLKLLVGMNAFMAVYNTLNVINASKLSEQIFLGIISVFSVSVVVIGIITIARVERRNKK